MAHEIKGDKRSSANLLLAGALAGALGGVAMKAVVRFIDRAAFGLSARTDALTTREIFSRLEWEQPGDKHAEQIGTALHYGFAVAAGVAYVASCQRFPVIGAGRGMAFGVALWLFGDELAVSGLGLEDPKEASLSSHLSALGAHAVYGLVVDSVCRATL